MKYFIDTEFIEGFHKPLFGKRRHFIDLISIGIVAEDGREYYAVSTEFRAKDADDWVRENVISKLPNRHIDGLSSPREREESRMWKCNGQIMAEIRAFFGYKPTFGDYGSMAYTLDREIEIYAYYADYDWVLFCSLFGRMIDLPEGMPMYCRDLKQMLDEAYMHQENKHEGKTRLEAWLEDVKTLPTFPTQGNEHNALDDAKWNRDLYVFLQRLNSGTLPPTISEPAESRLPEREGGSDDEH